jgi:exonuclease SbcC
MITRIELVNFMSHDHTVIEPSDGLTVLVGPNNCGKSALVAALQILAHNDNSTYVMRHGEREASVTVWTSEGDEITWRRKSSGGPSYTVNGRLFDRLGGSVPQEVAETVRLAKVEAGSETNPIEFDLHFGEQKSPVFLLNQQGAPAAQFFASSSDAEKLVRMQKLHKDKVQQAGRDKARLVSEVAGLETTLAALAPVADVERRVRAAEELYEDAGARAQTTADGRRIAGELRDTQREVSRYTAEEGALRALAAPPALADTAGLHSLLTELRAVAAELETAGARERALRGLLPAPELADTARLRELISALVSARGERDRRVRESAACATLEGPPEPVQTASLEETIARLKPASSAVTEAARAEAEAARELETAAAALREWAAQEQVCPTCGAELDPDRLLDAAARGFGAHVHEGGSDGG